jgi:chorismate dehydratase
MAWKSNKLRIGKINFTNVWPIFHGFPGHDLQPFVHLIEQVPTQLNRALAEGHIDMSPISSFSYGQYFRDYVLLPDLSVSSNGAVKSLLLFHKKPLHELDGAPVALPTTSATTVNMLKIIFSRFIGVAPIYTTVKPDIMQMLSVNDAALLIGDDAIRASWRTWDCEVTDLGELWKRFTGVGMSYAVWAVREEVAKQQPLLLKQIHDTFAACKAETRSSPEALIRDACGAIGGTESYWRSYFANLIHDFGPKEHQGLQLYYDYAWELGFLPERVQLKIWSERSEIQVNE